MPDPIVLELQRDALNPSFSTTELLRKAKVVAYKLNLKLQQLAGERRGVNCLL